MSSRSPEPAKLRHRLTAAHCWTTLALCCSASALASGADAPAFRESDLPPAAAQPAATSRASGLLLYLPTTLNHRDQGLQAALWRDEQLWLQRQSLLDLGFTPAAVAAARGGDDGWVALQSLPEIDLQYSAEKQSLRMTVPFSALHWASTEITPRQAQGHQASASRGLLLNYELYGFETRRARSLSALTELRYFQRNAAFSSTQMGQWQRTSGDTNTNPNHWSHVRLDTSFSQAFPDEMLSLRLGDGLTAATSWSRSTRIGGLQIGRNFGLQPYRNTAPIPALMGTSALPSDIALYINGIQQYRGTVPAGPFSLNTPTGITGMGQAQVVLTDALGRTTNLQYSFFGTPDMLAQGLSDWSAELGWVRKNYGQSSFDYSSEPMLSGTWRYGFSNQLTLAAHGEASRHVSNAGLGINWAPGSLGVLSVAAAGSQHRGNSGNQIQLGHQWNNSTWATSLQATRASSTYRDVAGLQDSQHMRSSGRAIVSYHHRSLGSFNLGALYLRNSDMAAQRYAIAGWSRPFGQQGSVSLNLNHDLDDHKKSQLQLTFNWFFEQRINAGSSLTRQDGRSTANVFASQSREGDLGWGWSANAQSDGAGQARLDYSAPGYEANGSIYRNAHSSTSVAAGINGSLVMLGGQTFASRRIDDSFAVVSSNGIPAVPIKRENSVIGSTNAQGYLLVPRLNAYHNNKLSIDTVALPAQMRLPQPDQVVTPTDRAGVLVQFDIVPLQAASVRLVDGSGQPLPVGSLAIARPAEAAGAQAPATSIVGYDGMVYFENLSSHARLSVQLPDGSRCQATLRWEKPSATEIPVLGPISCTP